jgi:hypothetical protein
MNLVVCKDTLSVRCFNQLYRVRLPSTRAARRSPFSSSIVQVFSTAIRVAENRWIVFRYRPRTGRDSWRLLRLRSARFAGISSLRAHSSRTEGRRRDRFPASIRVGEGEADRTGMPRLPHRSVLPLVPGDSGLPGPVGNRVTQNSALWGNASDQF